MDIHLVVALIINAAYLAGYRENSGYARTIPTAAETTAVIIFVIAAVFILGVTALFTIQSQNFSRNTTTNERFSRAAQS